jgi:CheY-specific phosphatase CheX
VSVCAVIVRVEGAPGPAAEMAAELEAVGLRVLHAQSVDEALKLLRQNPLVGLLLAEGQLAEGGVPSMIETVRRVHPDLPVLWITERAGCDEATSRAAVVLPPTSTAADVRANADELLRRHLYSDEIAELITRTVVDVMARSFNTTVTPGVPYLKANRNTMGPITAIVSFAGEGVQGRLLVSSTQDYLATVFRRVVMGSRPVNSEEAEDLAGETANQVAGAAKAWFVARGRPFEITAPLYVCGDMTAVRYKAGKPSLVVPFEEAAGSLFVQFCFDELVASIETKAEDTAAWGEVEFL